MKKLICCCAVDGTTGVMRNCSNTAGAPPPELVMGLPCELELRLFAGCADATPYPMEQLTGVASWSFAMDTDFSAQSIVKLVADNSDIRLSQVTEEGVTCTRLTIPLPVTHTAELAAALDGKETILLDGELIGYDAGHEELFLLQIKNFLVRGRLTGLGDSLSVLSALCGAMSEEAISGALVSGSCVTSSGAALIASGAAAAVSGALQSRLDTLSSGAMLAGQPFSTTVGGYTVELTSGGGVSIYGENEHGPGVSALFSNGVISLTALDGYNDTQHELVVHGGAGGIIADGSAITQASSAFAGTSLGIAELAGGVKYVCSSALSALSIGSAAPGCNVTIFFTAANGAIITPPANVRRYGVTSYTPGSSYVMAINGDMAVVVEEDAGV